MFRVRSVGVAVFVAALVVSACATSARGVMPANEPSHVVSVEVVAHDPSAPPSFAESLRKDVLDEAIFYGESGRPIILRIDLQKVHFKNMVAAMLIGDDNQAKGQVVVIDSTTGQQSGTFPVQVNAERPAGAGAFLATTVLGAFDPTGIVDIGSATGSAASADIDRSGTTRSMIINFAAETLRQTFGDAKTKAAGQAKQAQSRSH